MSHLIIQQLVNTVHYNQLTAGGHFAAIFSIPTIIRLMGAQLVYDTCQAYDYVNWLDRRKLDDMKTATMSDIKSCSSLEKVVRPYILQFTSKLVHLAYRSIKKVIDDYGGTLCRVISSNYVLRWVRFRCKQTEMDVTETGIETLITGSY